MGQFLMSWPLLPLGGQRAWPSRAAGLCGAHQVRCPAHVAPYASSHDLGHTDFASSLFPNSALSLLQAESFKCSDSPGCPSVCPAIVGSGLAPLPWQGKNQVMLPQHRQNFCSFSWKGRVWSHLEKPPLKLAKQEAWSEG